MIDMDLNEENFIVGRYEFQNLYVSWRNMIEMETGNPSF